MTKFLNKLLTSAVILLATFGSAQARAACDGCVVAAVAAAQVAIVGAITTLNQNLTLTRTKIVESVKGVGKVITTSQARAAKVVASAVVETGTQLELAANVEQWEHPDVCGVNAAAKGVDDSARGAVDRCVGKGCARGGGGGKSGGGVPDNQNKALAIAAGTRPAPEPEVQAALASSGACGGFAGADGSKARMDRCIAAGFSANATNGHPDADIRADTLFEGPQKPGARQRRLTVSADETTNEYRAVESLMKNLDTPLELRELKKAELNTDAGRKYMTLKDAYEARLSMAMKPAKALFANRTEDRTLIPVMDQLLAGPVTKPYVTNYLARNVPQWKSKGISFDEMVNIEVSRRHLNNTWHIAMAAASPESHTREQTSMMALELYLLQQMNTKLDYIATAAGQTMATGVRAEMLAEMKALHSTASK